MHGLLYDWRYVGLIVAAAQLAFVAIGRQLAPSQMLAVIAAS